MKKSKNPLSVSFGALLRAERNSQGLSSYDVATAIELGESYYRLVESGNVNIPISKVFPLIAAFEFSNFDFQQLAKLIAGIHYIDDYKSDSGELKDALSVLGEMEKTLDAFFKNCKFVEVLDEEPGAHKGVVDAGVINELKLFLSNNYYSLNESENMKRKVSFVSKKLEEAPSLNLELMINFINELSSHPPLHTIKVAKQWEEINYQKFRKLRGVYGDTDLILNRENLANFKYSFLSNPNFELQFIFVSDQSSQALKQGFIEGLVETNNDLKEVQEQLEQVINIRTVKSSKKKMIEPEKFEYGYWAFHMASSNIIGFTLEGKETAVNISFQEALELDSAFSKLWEKL